MAITDKSALLGPIRPLPQADTPKYREREERARLERHQRAGLHAAELLQAAAAEPGAEHPVWVRAAIHLAEAIRADVVILTVAREDTGLRCRVTRGAGLEELPSRRWSVSTHRGGQPDPAPTRVEIDPLPPGTAPVGTPGQPVPGATASFHSLLYMPGSAQPLGCLSLYARSDLSLVADRVAFIHAVAAALARELAEAPLPTHPSS